MRPNFYYTLVLVFRSRSLLILFLIALVLLGLAWVASGFSPRQPQTVALDVGISFIRLILPLLGILLVQELVVKEIERKTILTTLTYPRSRLVYLLGRYAGIAVVLGGVLVALGALLGVEAIIVGESYQQATPSSLGLPYLLTLCLVWLDVLVILAFTLLLAAIATTPSVVLLGGLGFMVVARSIGTALQILQSSPGVVEHGQVYRSGLHYSLYAVPDLGLLDIRAAALYGKLEIINEPWWLLLLVPLAYGGVLLGLAVWRFSRRQFA